MYAAKQKGRSGLAALSVRVEVMTRLSTVQTPWFSLAELLEPALAGAPAEDEGIPIAEMASVREAWEDIELGLTIVHDRRMDPDGMGALAPGYWPRYLHRDDQVTIEWTRVADMQAMSSPTSELEVRAAVEVLATTAHGDVRALGVIGEYRLHVGTLRVRFALQDGRVRVLGVFPRATPRFASAQHYTFENAR